MLQEDKRISCRRKKSRRAYDLLQGKATEEERQRYDWLLWSRNFSADRRVQARRSGPERRMA